MEARDEDAGRPAAEELERHAAFLRRVAAGILGDAGRAEDVVQDTFAAALERPPERPRNLRAWLGAVARNLARMRIRAEARRARREAGLPAPGAIAGPAEIAARLEMQRRVLAELDRLDEPTRAVLFHRFFDGLSPKAIAERTGESRGAVRMRIHRGLGRLRDRFGVTPEDRRRSRALLLLLLHRRPPAPVPLGLPPLLLTGAALMTKNKIAAAAAALLLIAAGTSWYLARPAGPTPPAPPTVAGAAPAEPETADAAANAAPPADVPAGHVLVHVLSPDGEPVPGARLSLAPRPPGADPIPLGRTDLRGASIATVAADLLPGRLRAEHPDFGPGDTFVTAEIREATLRLGRTVSVRGVVVDESGRPVAAARVTFDYRPQAADGDGSGSFESRSRTSEDGSFAMPGVGVFGHGGLLTVRAEGFATARLPVRSFGEHPIRVVLSPPVEARVRLVDGGGDPIVGALAVLFSESRPRGPSLLALRPDPVGTSLPNEGDGFFSTGDLPAGRYCLVAAAPGHRPLFLPSLDLRRRNPPPVFVLERASGVTGTVVDATTGAPIGDASVSVIPDASVGTWNDLGPELERRLDAVARVRTTGDGRFFHPLADPDDSLRLAVRAAGYRPEYRRLSGAADARPLRIGLTSRRGPDRVTGRVVDPDGRPIPGAVVTWFPEGTAVAGPDGSFEIGERTSVVSISAPGYSSVLHGLADGEEELVVRMAPAVRVSGTAVDERGDPICGARLLLRADSPDVPSRSVATDGEGEVLLALPAGSRFTVHSFVGWTGEAEIDTAYADSFRIVLSRVPAGALSGFVRPRRESDPLPDRLSIELRHETGVRAPSAEVARDGSFRFEGLRPGRYTLEGRGTPRVDESDRTETLLPPRTVVVTDGEVTELDLGYAPPPPLEEMRLEVEGVGGPPTPIVRWCTEDANGTLARGPDGAYRTKQRRGVPVGFLAFSPDGSRAAVASEVAGAIDAVSLRLAPAGRVRIPPLRGKDAQVVRVETPDGRRVFDCLDQGLPREGDDFVLPLPPGDWTVSIGPNLESSGRTFRVRVAAGETVELR